MHARDLYRRLKVYGIALNRSDVFETSFLTENQILPSYSGIIKICGGSLFGVFVSSPTSQFYILDKNKSYWNWNLHINETTSR